MKNLILGVFLLTFSLLACNNNIMKNRLLYENNVKHDFLKKNPKYNSNEYTVKIYPFFRIDLKKENKKRTKIYLDTSICAINIISKNRIIAFQRQYGNYFGLYKHNYKMLSDENLILDSLFFLYCTKLNIYNCDIIGYYDNNSIKFKDAQGNIFSSKEKLIINKYGIFDKYAELIAKERYKEKVNRQHLSYEEAKLILKNNYNSWQVYFPEDTTKIISLFLQELDSLSGISSNQKTLLLTSLLKRLRTFEFPYASPAAIGMLKEDITITVRRVLTDKQYFEYIKESEKHSYLKKRASDKMYFYCKKVLKIPDSLMNNYYKQKILYNEK